MVRVKYRYLAIQVIPERKMTVTAEMVKKMISKAVIEEFGYKSALSLYSLQIIDTCETLHIFNIKVLREIHLEIKKSLATFYKSSTGIRIDTVAISGSIRGLRKKVIALSKKD